MVRRLPVRTRPNPFDSPYDAYITYMNVLADFFEMRPDRGGRSAGGAGKTMKKRPATTTGTTGKETAPPPRPEAQRKNIRLRSTVASELSPSAVCDGSEGKGPWRGALYAGGAHKESLWISITPLSRCLK